MCVRMISHFICVWLFVTLWTVARQAPLSMGFFRKEYWSGLPCPPPGDLPDPGIEPMYLMSPALAAGFFALSPTWKKPTYTYCAMLCLIVTPWISPLDSSVHGGSPDKNTGVDCHALLQENFPTDGSDNQQELTVKHRELYIIFHNNL